MKKIISLVLALCMMLMVGAAFAGETGTDTETPETPATNPGNRPVDTTIEITKLTDGDTVNLFKVLEWVDGEGWRATSAFDALVAESGDNVSAGVKAYVANSASAALTADDVAKIAAVAQGKTPTDTKDAADGKYTYAAGTKETAGMYIALITAKEPGTVYNPIIVSADFVDENGTHSIASDATIVGTAVAKKTTITVDKTEPKITNDVGDTYSYTIKTTIPAYSAAFTDTFFTVTDKVSQYLDVVASTITVTGVTGGTVTPDTDKHGFTVHFDHGVVSALTQATEITITYDATLNTPVSELTNVKEENNEVTVKFPNDPNDLTGKKVTALKDGTREYTFSIDGKLFGNSSIQTSELVKVGKDAQGNPLVEEKTLSDNQKHAALAGARYGLFTSKATAEAAGKDASKTDGLYTNAVFDGYITTDDNGLMEINGLDVGTYWLIELSAPEGYIKDQVAHRIDIAADINGDAAGEQGQAITEYYTVGTDGSVTWSTTQSEGSIPYTYYVPVLNSYTVTIDEVNTSTYTMTLDGPAISIVDPVIKGTDLVNTQGVELPSTGGIGTTIFYVLGGLLFVGAAVILVARRKADN